MGYERLFVPHFDSNTEGWLVHTLNEIDLYRRALEKSGVYSFVKRVLCTAECRDIPYPDVSVTRDGACLIDWKVPNGSRLFLSFGSPILYRYTVTARHDALGPWKVCRRDYAEKLRELLEKTFAVNSVNVEAIGEGGWE